MLRVNKTSWIYRQRIRA